MGGWGRGLLTGQEDLGSFRKGDKKDDPRDGEGWARAFRGNSEEAGRNMVGTEKHSKFITTQVRGAW